MQCYLELGLSLLFVRGELRERLLQGLGLRRVKLPLVLQDFGSLIVLPEPERQTHTQTVDKLHTQNNTENSAHIAVLFLSFKTPFLKKTTRLK